MLAPSKRFSTSDGVSLVHKLNGTGAPCLFIHGGPGSGSEIVERLAGGTLDKSFTMIYLDQRGSGRSASATDKNYSLERVVQDMEELRAHLKIEKWVVMAHSFGGIIATEYARKHPERISGLVWDELGVSPDCMVRAIERHDELARYDQLKYRTDTDGRFTSSAP